jgi:hypothetical protein
MNTKYTDNQEVSIYFIYLPEVMKMNADRTATLKWGVEQRLEFIEFRLFWEGGVNRGDIIDMFGVSVPQASKDLTLYQEHAPKNAVYDKSAKRYVAGPKFVPKFLKADPDMYLSRLRSLAEGADSTVDSWISKPPAADIALTPRREIDLAVLRAVLDAVREGKSLEVHYQSMSKARVDPLWRRITPHAFGFDGFRWHVRAYCHLNERFKDFLLPRILGVREMGVAGTLGDKDALWQEFFELQIAPHPDLAASQQAVVAKDYGMVDGQVALKVRCAMLFYVLKRLGLLGDATAQDPRTQHIVAINAPDVEKVLRRLDFEIDDGQTNPNGAA